MDSQEYLKINCPLCGGSIEFPSEGFGQEVECPHCNQKIRLRPPLPLRNPWLAFVLTFFTGPLGFFYVSWRTGVMSCIAFALASLIWIGLNVASIAGWPIAVPYLEIEKSFAPFVALPYTLFQQAFLGFWCAVLTTARNNSIQIGGGVGFGFATGQRLFRLSVVFPYGLLAILPWALNDFFSGILCIIHASFFWGIVLLLMPHAWIALIGYVAGLAIVRALISIVSSTIMLVFFPILCLILFIPMFPFTQLKKWRIKLYRFAADTNMAETQLVLGNCYAAGDGVPQDYVEAVKWYRKAAERNDEQAQFNLGTCYHFGTGVEKDILVAVKWYRKAAEGGDVNAQSNLGTCYATGDGVSQDEVEAYKWFLLAAGQGYAPTKSGIAVSKTRLTRITVVALNKIKEKLAALESQLTPEQIAEGQKLAREFKPHTTTDSGNSV
jgi:hypothetical protein